MYFPNNIKIQFIYKIHIYKLIFELHSQKMFFIYENIKFIWSFKLLSYDILHNFVLVVLIAGESLSQAPEINPSSRTDCNTSEDCKPFCSHFPGSLPICVRHICGCIVPENVVSKIKSNSETFVHYWVRMSICQAKYTKNIKDWMLISIILHLLSFWTFFVN